MEKRTDLVSRGATQRQVGLCAIAIGLFACAAAPSARAAHPNALWRVVHDLCATDVEVSGNPAPCAKVDLARGIAILKDIRGATQLLLVPTKRISGIEDPQLLEPASPNYWQAAWEARPLFEQRAGQPVPRDEIGLAINSAYGRSQSQLHIHIDCIRPDVRRALEADESRIRSRWSTLNVALAGRHYRAMRLNGADLGARDPFKLLARNDPRARANMGRETLVVVGASFKGGRPGFVLLSGRAKLRMSDQGHGEELLDHSCKVLAEQGRGPDDGRPSAAK